MSISKIHGFVTVQLMDILLKKHTCIIQTYSILITGKLSKLKMKICSAIYAKKYISQLSLPHILNLFTRKLYRATTAAIRGLTSKYSLKDRP